MYLLAIETTGAYASVALLQAEKTARILSVIHGNDRFSHLQNLTPQIDQILKDNQLQIGDVDVIAVSHGPGSFTGIRIGVATARALGQILGTPCVAVSSLEALALRALQTEEGPLRAPQTEGDMLQTEVAPQSGSTDGSSKLLLCPALDARRKQVYGAAYEIEDGRLSCRIPERSILMVDFLQKLEEIADQYDRILFLGDGIDTCGELIRQWALERREAGTGKAADGNDPAPQVMYAPEEIRYQDAAAVALRGLQLWNDGKACDYIELQPEYLRMAEAEKKLKERKS